MRYFLEIKRVNDHYEGLLHKGNPATGLSLPQMALNPHTEITIKRFTRSLEELVTSLLTYHPGDDKHPFDERGQLEFGQYLYMQIFGGMGAISREFSLDEKVEIRIVTQDEHIMRLPWALLADNGVFLSTAGWSVAFSNSAQCQDCELPPSPRVLLVTPQPAGLADTGAAGHIEAIEERLSEADHLLARNRNLHVVETWEDFIESIEKFQPQIVYYYGHGVSDLSSSRLLFASKKKATRLDKPISDISNCLRMMRDGPPLLVYLNCCLGDAGGLLGAGKQLGTLVPAVITNYTLAQIDASQAQGLSILDSILLNASPPHLAVAEMRSNLSRLNLSFSDLRWMTPVLHYHYDHWKGNRPQRDTRLTRDSQWRFKLDRVRQFGQVAYQTTQMLRARKPRCLAYVWYGQEGQGVDLFHQRLKVELQEHLQNTSLYQVRPEWPVEFSNAHLSFENMLTEAFGVQSLEDIPARIRTQTRGASDRQTLVYVRHQPVHSSKVINPKILKSYLEWWECNFVPLIDNQSFALLGISFIVANPANFVRVLEGERIADLELDSTLIQILDEMERLSKKDLLDFLQTHNIRLPRQRKDRLLDAILAQTQGNYEMTLEALKDIANRAWDLDFQEVSLGKIDYDYD